MNSRKRIRTVATKKQWPAAVAPTLRANNGTPFMGDQDYFSNRGGAYILVQFRAVRDPSTGGDGCAVCKKSERLDGVSCMK